AYEAAAILRGCHQVLGLRLQEMRVQPDAVPRREFAGELEELRRAALRAVDAEHHIETPFRATPARHEMLHQLEIFLGRRALRRTQAPAHILREGLLVDREGVDIGTV